MLVFETLRSVADLFSGTVRNHPFGVPVEKVIEAARPVEAEFSALIEGVVIYAVVGNENVQTIGRPEANRYGTDAEPSDKRSISL